MEPGPGGAVAGAEDVDAEDAVVFEVEQAAGSKELRPPLRHLGGAGEGVADENDVVSSRR